ncbi:hypothetical protein R3P38DRAFT_3566349 [Favolaschia claudopus]|uniref:Uncharacterized protein n=1 Tax=Favolaschia claudopus TaxID=2862362 RepID=A0AAW0DVU1_9AGAR
MSPIRRSRCTSPPGGNINSSLPDDPYITIHGTNTPFVPSYRIISFAQEESEDPVVGGGMHGGPGGNGEGPQLYISAAGNILVNRGEFVHISECRRLEPSIATDPRYDSLHSCNPQELVRHREAPTNYLVPILRCLSEYIQGDKEKACFVIYCALFTLLLPGSLKLTDRLRLVPLIALPFLAIPHILSLNDTITLVDAMGQRRPILLTVWKNQKAFATKLQEFFVRNEVIMDIIRSEQYQIQDAEYSVHHPGSRLVAAGNTLFMAALFYRSRMKCPWRSFSTSNANSPTLGNLDSDEASSSTLASDDPNIDQPSQRSNEPAGRRGPASNLSLLKFVHLLLLPRAHKGRARVRARSRSASERVAHGSNRDKETLRSSNLVGSAIDDDLSPTSSIPSSRLPDSWTDGFLAPPPADMYTRSSPIFSRSDTPDWSRNDETNPTEALEHPLAQQQHILQPPSDWSPENSSIDQHWMLYRNPSTSSLFSSDASASPNPSADWETFSAHSPFSAASPFGGSQLEDPETQSEVQQDHNDDSPKTSSSNETERGLERQQNEYLDQDLARLLQLGGDENSLNQTSSNGMLDPVISGQGSSTGMLPLPEGGPASYSNGDSIFRAIVQSDAGRHASAARRKHKNRIAPFRCDICQADFTAKHNLRNIQEALDRQPAKARRKRRERSGVPHLDRMADLEDAKADRDKETPNIQEALDRQPAKARRRLRERSGVPALDRALYEEDDDSTYTLDDDWDFAESANGKDHNGAQAQGTSLFARGVVDRYRLAVFRKASTPGRAASHAEPGMSVGGENGGSPSPAQRRGRTGAGLSFREHLRQFLRPKPPWPESDILQSMSLSTRRLPRLKHDPFIGTPAAVAYYGAFAGEGAAVSRGERGARCLDPGCSSDGETLDPHPSVHPDHHDERRAGEKRRIDVGVTAAGDCGTRSRPSSMPAKRDTMDDDTSLGSCDSTGIGAREGDETGVGRELEGLRREERQSDALSGSVEASMLIVSCRVGEGAGLADANSFYERHRAPTGRRAGVLCRSGRRRSMREDGEDRQKFKAIGEENRGKEENRARTSSIAIICMAAYILLVDAGSQTISKTHSLSLASTLPDTAKRMCEKCILHRVAPAARGTDAVEEDVSSPLRDFSSQGGTGSLGQAEYLILSPRYCFVHLEDAESGRVKMQAFPVAMHDTRDTHRHLIVQSLAAVKWTDGCGSRVSPSDDAHRRGRDDARIFTWDEREVGTYTNRGAASSSVTLPSSSTLPLRPSPKRRFSVKSPKTLVFVCCHVSIDGLGISDSLCDVNARKVGSHCLQLVARGAYRMDGGKHGGFAFTAGWDEDADEGYASPVSSGGPEAFDVRMRRGGYVPRLGRTFFNDARYSSLF